MNSSMLTLHQKQRINETMLHYRLGHYSIDSVAFFMSALIRESRTTSQEREIYAMVYKFCPEAYQSNEWIVFEGFTSEN
jgi:hypothetical protein